MDVKRHFSIGVSTMNKTFAPSRTALIIQTCFFGILSIPAGINFYVLLFNPTEIPTKDRTGCWIAAVFLPLGFIVSVLSLRRHHWFSILAVWIQFSLTCFLLWAVIDTFQRSSDDWSSGFAQGILVPLMVCAVALSLSHIKSIR